MAIKSFKMGPGTLRFGAAGALDVTCQIKSCVIECDESVKDGEPIDVLCGETLTPPDDVTYKWKLSGKTVQELEATGFTAWTWAHKGENHPFEFIPSTAGARKVTGTARISPLPIGGDVKSTPEGEFTFTVIGDPTLTNV